MMKRRMSATAGRTMSLKVEGSPPPIKEETPTPEDEEEDGGDRPGAEDAGLGAGHEQDRADQDQGGQGAQQGDIEREGERPPPGGGRGAHFGRSPVSNIFSAGTMRMRSLGISRRVLAQSASRRSMGSLSSI